MHHQIRGDSGNLGGKYDRFIEPWTALDSLRRAQADICRSGVTLIKTLAEKFLYRYAQGIEYFLER